VAINFNRWIFIGINRMKKLIKVVLLPLVLLFVAVAANAQNTQNTVTKAKGPLAYRLGITVNLPLVNAYTDTFKARTGWGLWGEAEYFLATRWRMHPTLAYNNFGYSQTYHNDSAALQTRNITEHYFEPKVLFSFLTSTEPNSASVYAGAGASLLVGRKVTLPDVEGVNVTQLTLDNKKSMSYGLLLTAGFMAPLSSKIDLGVQYTLGLPSKVYPLDITGRLGTIQVKLGFKIVPDYDGQPRPKKSKRKQQNFVPLYYKDSICFIVRLKENLTRITLLEQQGFRADAQFEREKTREENLKVMNAFKDKFTACPVYFIYDTDSKAAVADNFKGILLNANLNRDSTLSLPPLQHLFTEFARQFDEVSQTSGMFGLVVYNEKFKNIPPPFPSFVSDAYGILKYHEVVERYQKRLLKYYKY
jgi:hypothetical protein